MNELRDRIDRELSQVPVAPTSVTDIVARADRHRRLRRIGTMGLALILTLGSVGLITRAFNTSPGTPSNAVNSEERIVFSTVPWPDVPAQLYSVRDDGSGLRQLTQPDADYLTPAVSPDGSRIAFVRFIMGSDPPQTAHEGIYVMGVDGSDMHELLRTGEPIPISVSQLAWSPDGSQIAFIRNFLDGRTEAERRHELWVMDADGSQPHKVTDRQVVSFSWSPDGSRIAIAEQALVGERYTWDIYVMDADGGRVERLTQNGRSRGPAWSPDGKKLAFHWGGQILVMNADGTQTFHLTNGPESYSEIAWSPDSSALAIDAYDRQTRRCSILTVTLQGDLATVLESLVPDIPPPGGETPRSLCAGGLAWVSLRAGA
jgi:Tol biopolymer transport system component